MIVVALDQLVLNKASRSIFFFIINLVGWPILNRPFKDMNKSKKVVGTL